jgi:major cell surface glycoprotein (TIGR04216 family)
MVLSVVAMTTTFAGMAAAANAQTDDSRTNEGLNSAPNTVYLGEEGIDISGVTSAAGGASTGSETFIGEAGDADGDTNSVTDVTNVDITEGQGWQTGGYRLSSSGTDTVDLSVKEPRVTDVTIYRGDEDNQGADITGSSVPTGDYFSVEGDFNFDVAAAAEVTITDETGTDITNQFLASSPEAGGSFADGENDRWFEASGDSISFNTQGLDTGEYTIEVSGDDDYAATDTDFSDASMTATLNIRTSETTISVNKEETAKGGIVTSSVTGSPGEVRVVQLQQDDLADDTADNGDADNVFRNTDDVLVRHEQDNHVAALVDLGDSGTANVQLDTDTLEDDNTATLEVVIPSESGESSGTPPTGLGSNPDTDATGSVPGDFDGTAAIGGDHEDDVDVRVNQPAINIDSAPSVLVIGEDFDITGTAPEIEEVAAYARVNDNYYLLQESSGGAIESVDGDDTFEIEDIESETSTPLSGSGTQNTLSLPGSYPVVVAATGATDDSSPPVQVLTNGGAGIFQQSGVDTLVSDDDMGEIDEKARLSIRTQRGSLEASLDTNSVAYNVGDEVEVSGTSVGNGDSVRYYVLGPRGSATANSVSVEDDNNFSEDVSQFTDRGTYNIVLIGRGRDSNYARSNADLATSGSNQDNVIGNSDQSPLAGSNTREQNLEVIRDVYEDAGVDDNLVMLSLQAENAQLTIDPLSQSGTVTPTEVTITGTSNREDDTEVFIEVLNTDEESIASATADVDGSTSSWETTIDMSSVPPGSYTIRAQDDESTAERDFQLASSTPTATPDEETPTPEDDTPTEEPDTPTETDSPTPTDTPEPDTPAMEDTDTDSPTETTGPGFGVVVGILALLGAGLLATRRRD